MLDFTAPPDLHYYFTCPFLKSLTDEVINSIVEHCESSPTAQTQVVIEHMHGSASRLGVAGTAFACAVSNTASILCPPGIKQRWQKDASMGERVRLGYAGLRRFRCLCELSGR